MLLLQLPNDNTICDSLSPFSLRCVTVIWPHVLGHQRHSSLSTDETKPTHTTADESEKKITSATDIQRYSYAANYRCN